MCCVKNRPVSSTKVWHYKGGDSDLTATSFVDRSGVTRKNTVIISTYQKPLHKIRPSVEKPAVLQLYQATKGWTEVVGQDANHHSVRPNIDSWTLDGFSYLLDTAFVNAQTLCIINNDEMTPDDTSSLLDMMDLAKSLITPHINRQADKQFPNLNKRIQTQCFGAKDIETEPLSA